MMDALLVAGGLVALVIVLLLIPVRLWLVAESQAPIRLRVTGDWLLGSVRFVVFPSSAGEAPDEPPKESSPSLGLRSGLSFVRTPGIVDRTKRFAKALLASFHPRVHRLRIELGLGDPAYTGEAWAFFGPLSGFVAQRYRGRIELHPNFAAQVLAVDGRARFTLVPLQVLGVVLGFIASPVTVRAVYRALRAS